MKLIIGFVFFGLLFYSIWFYYPETFQVMVSWAAKVFDFIRGAIEQLTGKSTTPTTPPAPAAPHALLFFS